MSKPINQQIFDRAFELVKNPETWTRGCCARDKDGNRCDANSSASVSFCSFGAIIRAYYEINGDLSTQTASKLMAHWFDHIVYNNDCLPHHKVVEIWERARERIFV